MLHRNICSAGFNFTLLLRRARQLAHFPPSGLGRLFPPHFFAKNSITSLPLLALHCHSSTPCPSVLSLYAEATRLADGSLHLRYILTAKLADLRIPSPLPASVADGLWEHTCFEAFIGAQNEDSYHEFNFSPSSQWAAYAFSTYRERVTWASAHDPRISITQTDSELRLEAFIAAADLPPNPAGKPLQLGLTAVLEMQDGSKSYWALEHPAKRPDFHHRNGFAHEIWP